MLWWCQETDEFFDLNFRKEFGKDYCQGMGFYLVIKAFTSKNYKHQEDSYVWEIEQSKLISDSKIPKVKVLKFLNKLSALKKIDYFKEVEIEGEYYFQISMQGMSLELDNYNRRKRKNKEDVQTDVQTPIQNTEQNSTEQNSKNLVKKNNIHNHLPDNLKTSSSQATSDKGSDDDFNALEFGQHCVSEQEEQKKKFEELEKIYNKH